MSFPGHSATTQAARAPSSAERLPPIDEHVVRPESGEELIDGERRITMGANPPHAVANGDLAALLATHATEGYLAAVDLLTRTDRRNNFAPDASVFPRGEDPATGGRQLECLAFEIVDTQTRAEAAAKAAKLAGRGVERVFCLDLNEYAVLEWDAAQRALVALELDATIDHPCLVRPLAISALLDATERDDEVARALLIKQPPALVSALAKKLAEGRVEGKRAGKAEGKAEGLAEGLREAIRGACELLGIEIDEAREREISSMSVDDLRALHHRVRADRRWE